MLVITRKKGESFVLAIEGDRIAEVTVADLRQDAARLAVDADDWVQIRRSELAPQPHQVKPRTKLTPDEVAEALDIIRTAASALYERMATPVGFELLAAKLKGSHLLRLAKQAAEEEGEAK